MICHINKVNLAHFKDVIDCNYIPFLRSIGRASAVLTGITVGNMNFNESLVLFEDIELQALFMKTVELVHEREVNPVSQYLEMSSEMDRSLFVDISLYIQDFVDTSMKIAFTNIITITLDTEYRLDYTVKNLIMRDPNAINNPGSEYIQPWLKEVRRHTDI